MLDYIEAAVLIVVLLGLAGWFYLEKRLMYYMLGFIIFLLLGILAIVEIQRGLDTYDQD